MTQRRPPEGTPISQREWDRLSDASRRWLLEAAGAIEKGAAGDSTEPDEIQLDARADEERTEA